MQTVHKSSWKYVCQISAKCLPNVCLDWRAKQNKYKHDPLNPISNAKRVHSCALGSPEIIDPAVLSILVWSLLAGFDWRAKQKTNTRQCQKSAQFSSCQPRNQQSCSLANPRLKPSCRPRREATQKANTSTIHWIQSAMQRECTV